jgi:CheY-like chemotaxis protein
VAALTGSGPERTRLARLALMREELVSPVTAMRGYREMLSEAAGREGLADLVPDLERLAESVDSLAVLIETLFGDATPRPAGAHDLGELEASLRHDLRTPLNGVIGYGELILEDLDDGAEHLRLDLEKLLQEARKLLQDLDRIVDFTRRDRLEGVDDLARRLAENFVRSVAAAPPADAGLTGTILVVDDQASNRDVLRRRLEHDGHDVATATDAASALALLEERPFDVALLDLLMPGMNGYELLSRIKAEPRWRELGVIVVSGLHERETAIRCIEAGADDFLDKPVNPILLRARINACLERRAWQERESRYVADLAEEKARADALLHNILPRGIVSRLNGGEHFIADGVEAATVLFCDIVDFTGLANTLRPALVVDSLNRLFSEFDRLAHEQGVEKIKPRSWPSSAWECSMRSSGTIALAACS